MDYDVKMILKFYAQLLVQKICIKTFLSVWNLHFYYVYSKYSKNREE
jgi:hypothetical protein